MIFAAEIGHKELQEKIWQAYQQNKLSHAYLFHGPEGCAKELFALHLAKLLNSPIENGQPDLESPQAHKVLSLQHPDVKLIFPTPAKTNLKDDELQEVYLEKARNPFRSTLFPGKNTFIGIDTIRELKKESGFKLYEGMRKVFIISQADQMRVEAANALLKLLEEPPANLVLILTTANIHRILPTIKSRCQLLRFERLPEQVISTLVHRYVPDVDEAALPNIIRLAGYNLRQIMDFLEKDILPLRDKAIEFLRKVVLIHRTQELLEIVEPLGAPKNREEARILLRFLLYWFQDILYLQKLPNSEDLLYNRDQVETLKKFMAYTPDADISAIASEIERALQQLNDPRNFNPLLILTTLAIKLNQSLRNA